LYLFRYQHKDLPKKLLQKWQNGVRGWLNQNQKIDYWFYYYEEVKRKGHYEANKKVNGGFFINQIKPLIKKVSMKTIN
jgi:hypothetical protein